MRKFSLEHIKKLSESHKGYVMPKEQRRKISEANKGRTVSKLTREKISKSNRGKIRSDKTKKLLMIIGIKNPSRGMLGKHHSKKTKEKIKRTKLKLFMENKHPTCIDKGSIKWFFKINRLGYNFEINYPLMDIGYVVDGYDEEKHIIVEYDTPYHKQHKQKMRDLERQSNIIEYFESLNKPLKGFFRVDATQNYTPKSVVSIYGKKKL